MTNVESRRDIYYWKCDRPAAFHGTAQGAARRRPELESLVREVVSRHFDRPVEDLRDGNTQGNHLTYIAWIDGAEYFVRIEDGPERDDYLAVESFVMEQVRAAGVPTPRVYAADATRRDVPFAWQILERVPYPDLNQHFKAGTLAASAIADQLGRWIATWQAVPVHGFGPFEVETVMQARALQGLHETYPGYFYTRLDVHLDFLRKEQFLPAGHVDAIRREIVRHSPMLELSQGCLVHKDLALWNVLGSAQKAVAVIDWDDCVSGDPMDDLALLGCFHDGGFLRAAFDGYTAVRALPGEHVARFWLHLLRNMIFKAVIRVGAGYFKHDSAFFLIGSGGSGATLREQTIRRIEAALSGLRESRDPFSL